MNNRLVTTALLAIVFIMVTACGPVTGVQVQTPVPTSKAGTPAPNGQINVPGVRIQINAPGPNALTNVPDTQGHIAGILMGIWHGLISPVTMVISFVTPGVTMYEVHNDGSQYNLGFFLGVVILLVVLGALLGSRGR